MQVFFVSAWERRGWRCQLLAFETREGSSDHFKFMAETEDIMKRLLIAALTCVVAPGSAHNSFTGGYSGTPPGNQFCASSCHGGTSGILVVTGFPASYRPQQTYRIVIGHNGGSRIVNFNATTRLGTTSNIAGTFANVTNSALYTGGDGGVYANPHSIDSAVFQWTAPAAGSGTVNFYAAAFQGTTTSPFGQSSHATISAAENTTGVDPEASLPKDFALSQNYPNPFNPSTTIGYDLPLGSRVILRLYDALGHEVSTLFDDFVQAGHHQFTLNTSYLASGIYFYRIQARTYTNVKKLVVLK